MPPTTPTTPSHVRVDLEDTRQRLSNVIGRPLLPLTDEDARKLLHMSPIERTQWALIRAKAQDMVTKDQIKEARTVHPATAGPEETDEDRRVNRNARKRTRRARHAK